jgi:predicted ABC-class ATPase
MKDKNQLYNDLVKMDKANYKAYKSIKGSYHFSYFTLIIDHIQGDPFAAPSQVRVQIPHKIAGFPADLYQSSSRCIALSDYLTRQFSKTCHAINQNRGSGKSGLIAMVPLGQEILERSSILINDMQIEARFVVGLPAQGRRILGYQAAELLCDVIDQIVAKSLIYTSLNGNAIYRHVETVEDADWLREQLAYRDLVAFIPDGGILPRQSGIDDRPLKDKNVIPFQSPDSLKVKFNRPNAGKITGMGIPEGICLIVGGGYHGKSTLLQALELGIYNHVPDDGREFVVTRSDAVKIRAEDGRYIAGVNIAPFINQLPQGRDTTRFYSPNASGSTSQAANIIENLEAGSQTLLVDEDTTATNFMIRDHRMQQLISKTKEPITPFIDKIKQLYFEHNVSTLLVMGGSGDYFEIADTVIAMEDYRPYEVTEKARAIAQANQTPRKTEGGNNFGQVASRLINLQSIKLSQGKKDINVKVRDQAIVLGNETIDVSAIEQLIDQSQLKAIASAIIMVKKRFNKQKWRLNDLLETVEMQIKKYGLDGLTEFHEGDLSNFRRFELAATINRLRTLQVE